MTLRKAFLTAIALFTAACNRQPKTAWVITSYENGVLTATHDKAKYTAQCVISLDTLYPTYQTPFLGRHEHICPLAQSLVGSAIVPFASDSSASIIMSSWPETDQRHDTLLLSKVTPRVNTNESFKILSVSNP